jgi:hypothetical protein
MVINGGKNMFRMTIANDNLVKKYNFRGQNATVCKLIIKVYIPRHFQD